jgi:creatinase
VWFYHATPSNRGIQDDRKHAPSDSPAQRRTGAKHFLDPRIRAAHNLLQYRTFGYGHSFGTLSHYYGREAGLELREDIDTILEPNMVISMEPMIMLPEGLPGAGGYREHDILVITPEGNRNLTAFPYGPAHNIIKA